MPCAFNDRSSFDWKAFLTIRPSISIVDIDSATRQYYDEPELRARAAIMCST
jgi:hypothetical protein